MRVLVTGAGGRVGRKLITSLLEQGHEVVAFDLGPGLETRPGITYVQGALEDPAAVAAAAKGVEAVIHLGAFMSWLPADAPKLMATNVLGTFNVLEAVGGLGLRRFILASSGEVYPENNPAFLPVTEHHPLRPTTPYGMTKVLAEEMAWTYARRFNVPTVVLRFSHTQDAAELLNPDSFFSGPRFFLRSKIRQQRLFNNQAVLDILQPLDDGTEKLLLQRGQDGTPYRMNITETRDLVQGIVLALDAPRAVGEAINLGADEPVRFEEALALMARATGLPVVEACMPGPAVNYATSNAKARELLGFRPKWDLPAMVQEAASAWEDMRVRP